MKKFVLGVVVGSVLSLSTSIFASELIQVYLFPVKYVFNNVEKEVPEEYVSLNYNGHAYVPIRFIAENTNMNIGYNEVEQKVVVNYSVQGEPPAPVPPGDQVQPTPENGLPYRTNTLMPFGNLRITKEGSGSKISLQVYNDAPQNEVGGVLRLFDGEANPLAEVVVNHTFDHAGISNYETIVEGDISNYKYVTLNFGKVNGTLIRRVTTQEEEENYAIKDLKSRNVNDHQISQLSDKKINIRDIIAQMQLNDQQVSELIYSVIAD